MSKVRIDFDELAKELESLNNDDGEVLDEKEKLKQLAILMGGTGKHLEEIGRGLFKDVISESDDCLSLKEMITYCLLTFTNFNKAVLKILK